MLLGKIQEGRCEFWRRGIREDVAVSKENTGTGREVKDLMRER